MPTTEPSPERVTSIAEWTDVPAAMEAVAIRAQAAETKAARARAWLEAHPDYVRKERSARRSAAMTEDEKAARRAKGNARFAARVADDPAWHEARLDRQRKRRAAMTPDERAAKRSAWRATKSPEEWAKRLAARRASEKAKRAAMPPEKQTERLAKKLAAQRAWRAAHPDYRKEWAARKAAKLPERAVLTEAEEAAAKKAAFRKWYAENRAKHSERHSASAGAVRRQSGGSEGRQQGEIREAGRRRQSVASREARRSKSRRVSAPP